MKQCNLTRHVMFHCRVDGKFERVFKLKLILTLSLPLGYFMPQLESSKISFCWIPSDLGRFVISHICFSFLSNNP